MGAIRATVQVWTGLHISSYFILNILNLEYFVFTYFEVIFP